MVEGLQDQQATPIHNGLSSTARAIISNIKKFAGRPGEDLSGFLTRVQALAIACRVNTSDYGVLLLSCLEGNALNYCLAGLQGEVSWPIIEQMLRSRYTMPLSLIHI